MADNEIFFRELTPAQQRDLRAAYTDYKMGGVGIPLRCWRRLKTLGLVITWSGAKGRRLCSPSESGTKLIEISVVENGR